jgi:hypothetical protein
MTIPFLIWTLICATAAIGTVFYQFEWRKVVSIQLGLDQSVGKTALELQDLMNRIETINGIIVKTRAAIAAQTVLGLPLQPAARVVLEAQAKIQDSLLLTWKIKNTFFLLPSISWERPPADVIGPNALRWRGNPELKIHRYKFPRKSAARVFKGETNAIWSAEWSGFY